MSLLGESRPEPSTENGGQAPSTLGLVTMATPKHIKEVALTRATLHVLLEIQGTASLTSVREGLDLVAVLDVSGSMADDDKSGGGQKLSKMKNAMAFLISKLAPMDRLSIVTFASKEEKRCGLRAMKEDAKPALQDIVTGLQANGNTNISAGLKTALDIIRGRKYTQGRTGNIFLLSDGRQTNGDAKLLDAGDVPVYTFGIGKDADSELLSAIARNSRGGTFSTVKDGEVTKPFANLLGGALTVVAEDVVLTLEPFLDDNPLGLEKMEVVAGVGYYNADQVDMATGIITIRFGNLFRQENRKVVVKMTLKDATKPPAVATKPPADDDDDEEEDDQDQDATAPAPAANGSQGGPPPDIELASASLTYTAQGKPSSNGQADKFITVKRTATPATNAEDAAVLAELARLQHASLIREARLLADQKKLGEAKDKLMDALNNVENVVVDDGGNTWDMLRRELQHLLGLMKTQELYESEGRPFALACESSHGFQRYAGRGDGDGIRTFCTTRMDTYHQQAADFLADTTKLPPTAEEDVKVEVAANPTAAFSPELVSYLMTAIEALQAAIQKITVPPTKAK